MRRYLQWLMFLALLMTCSVCSTGYISGEVQHNMEVHFIDVGQGDSILIETPKGKVILIDGGPPKAGKVVVDYLKEQHIEKIDLVVATHPDIDHIGGLPAVMRSIEVAKIIDSGKLHTTYAYARYINQVRKSEIPIEIAKQGEFITLDPFVKIRILNTHNGKENNNQSSIVLKIDFKEIDLLLMGDTERKLEKKLMKQSVNLQSEIFKVAHHGSKTSTSMDFVKLVEPQVAIITYGKKNKFGHPVDRVIENLQTVNANIFSTAIYGNIVLLTDGKGYFIMTEKDPIDGLTEEAG